MARPLPPVLQELALTLGRAGYRVISAGVATGLKEVGTIVKDWERRIEHGQRAAERMAHGEPYKKRPVSRNDADEEEWTQ